VRSGASAYLLPQCGWTTRKQGIPSNITSPRESSTSWARKVEEIGRVVQDVCEERLAALKEAVKQGCLRAIAQLIACL